MCMCMMCGCEEEEEQKEEPEKKREQPIPGCEHYKRKMCMRYVKEETMETRGSFSRGVCICFFLGWRVLYYLTSKIQGVTMSEETMREIWHILFFFLGRRPKKRQTKKTIEKHPCVRLCL